MSIDRPLFDGQNSRVFAVNCSGYKGTDIASFACIAAIGGCVATDLEIHGIQYAELPLWELMKRELIRWAD